MKIYALTCYILILIILLSGCIGGSNNKNDSIGIVVSIPPYYEWATRVGGDKVDVTIMIPEGQSPHTYEPTPSQLIDVANAEIWVKNGVGLEFWSDKIIETNEEIYIVDVSEGIDLIEMGNGNYDPHLWLSIDIAKKGVEKIYEALSSVDPDNTEYYKENKDNYIQELNGLNNYLYEKLKGFSGKQFIVFHPAWTYFAREYDIVQIPIEDEGKEPGPRGIINIIEQAKEYGIKVIFVEPQFSDNNAKVIANEIDGIVVAINPLAADYIENMNIVANSLIEGMSKV